jgi:UDP-N-acetylmuramate dehydrogenase
MAPHTTLRIGGPAQYLVRLHSEEALTETLAVVRRLAEPFLLLGLGSNILVPDEGVPGVVALLDGEFLELEIQGRAIHAGGGLPLARVARAAVNQGLAGLEALSGFPSTVGGAVVMNAGCYGVEIKDVLESVTVVHPDGVRETLEARDLRAGYRSTRLQGSGAVVVRATFALQEGDSEALRQRLVEVNRQRRGSMPSGRPNAGSIFKNPPGDHAGRLIDACGLKGTRRGGAQISVEHANVIVNTGEAKAEEVLSLMAMMYCSVVDRFAVRLEPELILVGGLKTEWRSRCGID